MALGHAPEHVHRRKRRSRVFERGDALGQTLVRGQVNHLAQVGSSRLPLAVSPVDQPFGLLAQQPGRVALLVFENLPALRVRSVARDARGLHGLGVDEGRVPTGMRQQHGVVGRNFVERAVQRKAFHIRLRRVVPLGLVPSAPHDPLAMLGLLGGARHLRHDVVPRARLPQVQPQAKLADPSEMPVPLDEARDREHAVQVDDLRARPDPFRRVGIAAQRRDSVPAHRHGLGRGLSGVHGDDLPIAQHQVRGLPEGHCASRKQQCTHGH